MMTKKQEQDILGRAMLANVSIGMWEARKNDREVTDKVNDDYAASNDAWSWHKHLFGCKPPELSALRTASKYLRWTHYAQTLPWSDAGWRLLPTANYWEYRKIMQAKHEAFTEAVERFVAAYPRLVREAKPKLNGMYRASDYPTTASVRRKYHAVFDYMPIPSGDDFRVSLPKEELTRVAAEVEARVAQFVERAMQDAWARLDVAVSDLKSRLGHDAKGLRNGALAKLGELADVLGRLNLTNDPALEKARKQVLTQLVPLDAKEIKEDDAALTTARAAVDDILKQVRSVYTPAKEAE
jgi:hypothetical protein